MLNTVPYLYHITFYSTQYQNNPFKTIMQDTKIRKTYFKMTTFNAVSQLNFRIFHAPKGRGLDSLQDNTQDTNRILSH